MQSAGAELTAPRTGTLEALGPQEAKGQGTKRARDTGPDLGNRVAVFWPSESKWYKGCVSHVAAMDDGSGDYRHTIHYDDNDEQTYKRSMRDWKWKRITVDTALC